MGRSSKTWVAAVASAVAVAAAACRSRALSRSGAVAAAAVGTCVAGGGGWRAAAALVAFFVSSSAWSRFGPATEARSLQGRGAERDAVQVAANGGLPAFSALGMDSRDGWLFAAAFYGSLAAANADTWATEIGRRSARPPRTLLVGPVVAHGMSGGMTALGTAATIAGAAFLGAFAAGDGRLPGKPASRALAVLVAGAAGSLADSVLGATLQASRRCSVCAEPTEARRHCGQPTVLVRGIGWLDNDAVNGLATAAGALVAAGILARSRPE